MKRAGWVGALLVAMALPARAAQPFVNLGFTSFMDGFGDPTKEGFAFVQYLRFSTASSLKDHRGEDVAAFVDPQLDAAIAVTQLLYTFPTPEGFPLDPALSVLIPVALIDAEFGAGGARLVDNGLGVGDIFVGPAVQFPPVMSGQKPVLFHRLEFDVQVPIGKYDPLKQINQGNNAWALNPFWAGTLLAGQHLEISVRLHYLYNFVNDDPVRPAPGLPAIRSTQAGQAVHANIAASLEVVPKSLRVGFNSYVFRQFTDNEIDGVSVPDSHEQVIGLGPGVVWFPSANDLVFANVYFETAVRNRFQSVSAQIRWGHAFAAF